MNKKKIIAIISIIIVALTITYLYQTFAVSSIISGTETTYNVTLTNNSTVSVPARSSKIVYYQISNTNKGVVKYGVGYTSNNVVAKVYWDTKDPETGTIDYGETKFVKLKLVNESTNDDTINLTTVLGYEKGGELIPDSGVTLVTVGSEKKQIKKKNILKKVEAADSDSAEDYFLGSTIKRKSIATVTFVDDNIAPAGLTEVSVSVGDDSLRMWYSVSPTNSNLYDVYIGSDNGKVTIDNTENLFANMTNVTDINFNNCVDTSNATSMYKMFMLTSSLKNINFAGVDTSNVTNMNTMFAGTGMEVLDLTSFNTSNVIQMSTMFAQCPNLIEIKLSNWDTSKVTTMKGLFQQLVNDVKFDISNWDTSNVTNMSGMFDTSKQLTSLDLSNFDTSNVTDMQYMFNHCSNLTTLDLSHFDTLNVTDMSHMFNYCTSLVNINLNGWNTSNVTDMGGMFQMCSSLTSLDLSSFDTSNVTDISYMFNKCSKLTNIDLRNANFSSVTAYDYMFGGLTNTKIIVADATQKNWITSKFTNLTNVIDKTTL